MAIVVADLAACERFYRNTLGLRVVARHAFTNGQPRSVWLDLGGSVLMLERAQPAGEGAVMPASFTQRGGLKVLALKIDADDKAAWAAQLNVYRQTDHTLYVRDPEGNVIGLSHYPLPSTGSAPDEGNEGDQCA